MRGEIVTIKPKTGQFRGVRFRPEAYVSGNFIKTRSGRLEELYIMEPPGFIDVESMPSKLFVQIYPDSLGMYTGQFAKISPELAAKQPWRDVCPETGLTEIVGGYGSGEKRGGDRVIDEYGADYVVQWDSTNGSFVLSDIHHVFAICDFEQFEIIGTAWDEK